MQNVAFIINPFSAKKNYQPFLTSLKQKVENPLYIISKSIEDTENFIRNNFDKIDVFTITSTIILTVHLNNNKIITQTRRIRKQRNLKKHLYPNSQKNKKNLNLTRSK